MRRILFSAASLALVTLTLAAQDTPASSPAAKVPPAYESDTKFVALMSEAKQLRHEKKYDFAVDDYKKAIKISNGQCFRCLSDLYELQMGLNSLKDAVATAKQMQTVADSPLRKSLAEGRLGDAILKQAGDKPKPAQLEAAHAALQAAIADSPRNNAARWTDGCVLARMGKNDEASETFKSCAAAAPAGDPMRQRALHFAENPALALNKMAPAFEVTALDGTRFNLDTMSGRVVLIDFWATWCGPCNEELPRVKKIAREFAKEPLTIISISWDDSESKWKDFIQKNEMTWLQYRDADHKLSERFGVNAIPHYFTIDSDGVLTAEMLGSGSDVEGKLKKLLKRAKESRPTATQSAAVTTGTQ